MDSPCPVTEAMLFVNGYFGRVCLSERGSGGLIDTKSQCFQSEQNKAAQKVLLTQFIRSRV